MNGNSHLWIAVRAAHRAGEALSSYSPSAESHFALNDTTKSDLVAERVILDEIKQKYPDHNIISEEKFPEFKEKPRWIIDPLDGTVNFLNRIPHYAISIAFEGIGSNNVGVVYHVPSNTTFAAIENRGAYANGADLTLSTTSELSNALLVTGFAPSIMRDEEFGEFQSLLNETQGIRRFGSAASELAMVSAGQFDAFFERMLSPWDTAAGSLIVEEAGGKVTRIEILDDSNNEIILASNESLHQELISLIAS